MQFYTENKPDYNQIIKSLNISSDIHKQVRKHLISYIKPGIKLVDFVKIIENKTIEFEDKRSYYSNFFRIKHANGCGFSKRENLYRR